MTESESKGLKVVQATEDTDRDESGLTEAQEAAKLRDLEAKDIFSMLAVIKAIGVKEFRGIFDRPEIQNAINSAELDSESGLEAVGLSVMMELVGVFVDNLGNAEQQIYSLLASLSGLTAQEVAALPMMEFVDMLIELFKKDEFADFIQAASKLTK